jgi:hypothetical protein
MNNPTIIESNNISFFYGRTVIHPSLKISPIKYAENWNYEFLNLINFFSDKFSKSIYKLNNLSDSSAMGEIKIYSDVEFSDNFKQENTIKICEYENFSLFGTELDDFYVITLYSNIPELKNTFLKLTKLFKAEIYSKIENKYSIPNFSIFDFLEYDYEKNTDENKNKLTYPINFINDNLINNY